MRRFLVAIVGFALLVAACGGNGDDAQARADACRVGETDGDLSFYNWTEYIDPQLIEDFEAQYGVTVTETFYDSNEAMLAQVEAGDATYDLIVPSDYMVSTMRDAELLVRLNTDALSNLSNLMPTFASGMPFDPAAEFSVPYQWGTTGIGFSFDIWDDPETVSWGLVFDPEMSAPAAGEISLLNDERETLGAALKYLGFSVNTTNQAELEAAAALIADARTRIKLFDSTTFDDNLVAGETLVAHGWNGGFIASYDAEDAWEDYGFAMPVEGGVVRVDNMAIPTTTEHPCTAHTFIDFLLDAENGATLTNWNLHASPNAASEVFIDPEILADPIVYPPQEMLTDGSLEFIADLGDFADNYTDAFIQAKG